MTTSGPTTSALKVLVVTAENVHRQLAAGLLQMHGHECMLASSAQQALECLDSEIIDVVMLDLSLPNTDCSSFIGSIRDSQSELRGLIGLSSSPDVSASNLPPGIDDVLRIPLVADELQRVLDQFESHCDMGDSDQKTVEPAINLSKAAERIPGGTEGVRELAEIMLGETPRFLKELQEGLKSGDHKLAERAVHSLKGAADIFGADAVVNRAFEMEKLAKDGHLDEVALQLDELLSLSGSMIQALQELVDGD